MKTWSVMLQKMSKFGKFDLIIISMIVGFLICFMFLSDRFELHELKDLDGYRNLPRKLRGLAPQAFNPNL